MTSRTTSDELDGTVAAATTDGRRLRREQGRLAVVDAAIDLMLEGGIRPTAEQVAQRAEVSVASVHRYFSSIDELRRIGVQRYFERFSHLIELADVGEGPLPQRVERLVSARLDFYEATEPIARQARRQADDVLELAATLQRMRNTLIDQIGQHFADELADLRPAPRGELVAVLATLTSFEAWEQLRMHGLGRTEISRAWRTHLTRLLLTPDS